MHRSRLAVAGAFLVLAIAAGLGHRLAARLSPPPPEPDRRVPAALALVASWLDARASGDSQRVATYMLPGLADRGTLVLSPTSNPHVEAYFVYPLGMGADGTVTVQVILHEVYTGEPYGALYAETVTVDAAGDAMRITGWQPAGGPEVSAVGEGPPGRIHTLVYEDSTGRRVPLSLGALPARARSRGTGAEVQVRAERFGPLAVSPDGRYVAFSAAGPAASLLAVWDVFADRIHPLAAFPGAEVLDAHWSRSSAHLAVTVRRPGPAGRISVYTWPEAQELPVPWSDRLGGEYSLQALRWDALAEELIFGTAPMPGAATGPGTPGLWRLRARDLSVRRAAAGP